MDAVECVAEIIGPGVGCGDGVVSGLDLDGVVAACGPDEPACLCFDPAADGQGGEHYGQVGFEGVALVAVDGKDFSISMSRWQALITKSAVTGVPPSTLAGW